MKAAEPKGRMETRARAEREAEMASSASWVMATSARPSSARLLPEGGSGGMSSRATTHGPGQREACLAPLPVSFAADGAAGTAGTWSGAGGAVLTPTRLLATARGSSAGGTAAHWGTTAGRGGTTGRMPEEAASGSSGTAKATASGSSGAVPGGKTERSRGTADAVGREADTSGGVGAAEWQLVRAASGRSGAAGGAAGTGGGTELPRGGRSLRETPPEPSRPGEAEGAVA